MARRVAAILGVLACLVPAWVAHATGSTGSGSVSVVPSDGLVDQQFVAVNFTGMPSSEFVRVRECPMTPATSADCKKDSATLQEPGDQRVALTGSAGEGSVSFMVKAGSVQPANGDAFLCNFANACQLMVFALDGNGNDLGVDQASSAPIPFARSTVACPEPKGKGRVAGSGATSPAAAIVEWQAETCGKPLKLQLSSIITNSPQGKSSFIAGLTDSDFALSAIPLRDDEKAQLAATTPPREAVQVPITTGSLAFIYNFWEDFNRCDTNSEEKVRVTALRLSADTLARIVTARISNMSDPRIAADNPDLVSKVKVKDANGDCVTGTALPSRRIQIVGRADNSAATWVMSSYMVANAKSAWEEAGPDFQTGPTEIFPAGNSVDLRTGSAAVARQVRTFDGGQGIGDIPDAMWIGYVDSSVGRQVGLPSVALQNAAGNFVEPTTDNVNAGLQAATLNADGTVTPNYKATAPSNAYPMPVISYLITDKAKLRGSQVKTLKAFLAYALTTGQADSTKRGYVPLPSEMQAAAAAQTDSITSPSSDGGKGDGKGDGTGAGADQPPGVAGGSSDDGSASDGSSSSSDPLTNFTNHQLASARSGGGIVGSNGYINGNSADASPIKGSLAAQKLGPAGGPAGVVRALTVFLGLPLLVAFGLACSVGGRALTILSQRTSPITIREFFSLRRRAMREAQRPPS